MMNELQLAERILPVSWMSPQAIPSLVLGAWLIGAAIFDGRHMRLPNWLTLSGAALGVFLHFLLDRGGVGDALLGSLVGILLLLPLYRLRAIGAGDVKLLGMVGAFLGWPDLIIAALWIALTGGFFALLVAWRRGALRRLFHNVHAMTIGACLNAMAGVYQVPVPAQPIGKMPYGMAISVGTILFLLLRQTGMHT